MDLEEKIIIGNIEISRRDFLRLPSSPKEKLLQNALTIADQQRLIVYLISNPVLLKEHIDKAIVLLNDLKESLPYERIENSIPST